MNAYDPAREIDDQIAVFDLFEAKFGNPRRTIQFGQSGGGHVALAMAETRAHRIDGVVAACARTPVWLMNSELDVWFALQRLVAPDLPVTGIAQMDAADLTRRWREARAAAGRDGAGRARMALAASLGQFAEWAVPDTARPEGGDHADCTFTPGEIAAGVETMMRSLDGGEWGEVTPEALNRLALSLDPVGPARYLPWSQPPYLRTWTPPGGS